MYLIKRLLQTGAEELYFNTSSDTTYPEVIGRNITLFNTSGSSVNVYLAFIKKGDVFETGAILFEYPLAAHGYLELQERRLLNNDTIVAYASTADVVALSIDVIGGNISGRFEPAAP